MAAGKSVPINYRRNGSDHTANLVVARSAMPVRSVSAQRAVTKVNTPTERVWGTLGMRLIPISKADHQTLAPRYRGGMRVAAVRPGSSSNQSRIQVGDILLGLEGYETLNADNMNYVMDDAEKNQTSSLEFYVYRGGKLLKGWLQLGR